ncbi:MAG TPA: glycosyltransferase family 9 protein [Stellaceae bacterium]|jgi:ADP-heptose:LPS heptosyltransferase|nr:glycosyltransferase family 9 protein [Stellaceae bacterium]
MAGPVSGGDAPGPSEVDFPFLTRRTRPQTVTVRRRPEGDLAVFELGEPAARRREILILKLDHIGDFLMALPAFEALRRSFADDRITLICGPWNTAFATAAGVADEIRAYRFFPEDGALWTGEPVEGLPRFREVAAGRFDIAIDLRVDDDTRFLLKHVDAAVKAGIGGRTRHPYLEVLLPAAFERRESDPAALRIDPHSFQSRMPVQTLTHHETDFSTGSGHLVYGPDLVLPAGRFRATWDVDLRVPLLRFPGVEITLDVARDHGEKIVGSRRVNWRHRPDLSATSVEFDNPIDGAAHEFRLHARGRPRWARLRFSGVWVERRDHAVAPRFKPAELHSGEQLVLLARLVELRTRSPESPLPRGEAIPIPIVWSRTAARIVIAPVSNSRLRDWGLDNFSRLIELLLDRVDAAIALVGSPAQRALLAPIAARAGGRVVNLAGQTDWLQTAAVIREADLAISNNSGIGHLAAACGTPTLAIYSGSHQPQEWGPRGPRVRAVMALVPCSPCGYDKTESCPYDHRCMRQITPEAVAEEAFAMLSGPRNG